MLWPEMDRDDVARFQELTGCDEQMANFLLEATGGNFELAMNTYFGTCMHDRATGKEIVFFPSAKVLARRVDTGTISHATCSHGLQSSPLASPCEHDLMAEQAGHNTTEGFNDGNDGVVDGASGAPRGLRHRGGGATAVGVPPRPSPPSGGRHEPAAHQAPRAAGTGGVVLGRVLGLPFLVVRAGFGVAWAALAMAATVAAFVGDRVLPVGIMRGVRGE